WATSRTVSASREPSSTTTTSIVPSRRWPASEARHRRRLSGRSLVGTTALTPGARTRTSVGEREAAHARRRRERGVHTGGRGGPRRGGSGEHKRNERQPTGDGNAEGAREPKPLRHVEGKVPRRRQQGLGGAHAPHP